MAGKPKTMSIVKQLLQMHIQGKGRKTIAKTLCVSKTTVKSYLLKLSLLRESAEELVKLDDPVLESRFIVGNPAYADNRFNELTDKLDYYIKEMERTGVNRRLLWEEYRKESAAGYSYTQFCFHIQQHLSNKSPSMVLAHNAGEKLFIDFAGKTFPYIDPSTGEYIQCQIFVACFPYSGYGFVMAVPSQKMEDFFHALECSLKFFGGSPQVLVPDNLKAAVIKANRYEPELNRTLQDFANHYGFAVMPTRSAKPKDKAMVERYVNIVYTHVFARMRNEQHFSIGSLNNAIITRVMDQNQTRMQRKPYSRQECFLSDEKPLLKQLPIDDFEIKNYRTYKVAPNNFIYLSEDKHYYSVPHIYIGQKVNVIYTRSKVKIYYKDEKITEHLRSYDSRVLYVYKKEHLCSAHQHYLERSPEYYISRAQNLSKNLSVLIARKFECNQPPETQYRSCDGLLRLAKQTNSTDFEKACALAIELENYGYKCLQNIIKYRTFENVVNTENKPLPTHENLRGREYYVQLSLGL